MFDISDPLNVKVFGVPTGLYNKRFRSIERVKEDRSEGIATDTSILNNFETMICQLSRNAKALYHDIGANLAMSVNCEQHNNGSWNIAFENAADITLLDDMSDEDEESDEDEPDATNANTIEHYLTTPSGVKGTVLVNKLGMLGTGQNYISGKRAQCALVKIDADMHHERHYTAALVYHKQKFVIYFDTAGTGVPVSWGKLGRPSNRRARLRKQPRKPPQCFRSNDEMHELVCAAFETLLPGYQVVNLIERRLQRAEKDIYCQTWVFLIPYLLFKTNSIPGVRGKPSPYDIHSYLRRLSVRASLEMIRGWWQFLLYYEPADRQNVTALKQAAAQDNRIFKHLDVSCDSSDVKVSERFVVDTGATQTAISTSLASQLTCKTGPVVLVKNATANHSRPTMHVTLTDAVSGKSVSLLANVRASANLKHSLLGMDWIQASGWLQTHCIPTQSKRLASQALLEKDAELVLEVKRSNGMGKGLFTVNAIRKGTMIAEMEDPLIVQSDTYATRMGYPHDAVVWHNRRGYFDQGFQRRPGYRPLWYRMNHQHASRANVTVQPSARGPQWFAKRNIEAGEELKWDYGDHVDPAWNHHL